MYIVNLAANSYLTENSPRPGDDKIRKNGYKTPHYSGKQTGYGRNPAQGP